jgi:hypothetical protein
VQDGAAKAADQLGKPELAAAATRQQDAAFESAIGDRTGGQAGVDLVDLLLVQRRQIVGRDFRQLGRRNRIL